MLNPEEGTYRRSLGDDLLLCTATSEEDVEQVAAFNGSIHGPEVGTMTESLFLYHPATRGRDLFFVKDEERNRVVSSLCLIPWTWRFESVEIPVGELGIVGTSEPYRRRGLIRLQVDAFKDRLRERGCLLSQIQGIPHFYRQFGYEYALPLEGGLRLELRHVPASPEPSLAFRLATSDDVPILRRLYDEAAQDLGIHTARGEGTWRYLQLRTDGTAMERERWIIQAPGEQVLGYVSVPRYHFGEELTVDEASRLSFEAALAALQHLKELAVEREKPGIRLNLPVNCTLARLGRALAGHDLGTYAWQIHVPDLAALLQALGPVLESRIADSPFAGLTQDVRIDLYRETLALRFEAGQLSQDIKRERGVSKGDVILRCPPLQCIPLILGYRTWQDLHSTHPDVNAPPTWRLLVDTLFPKLISFLYSPY
jgi:GNAT superfamily N-acetyltransferase